VIASRITGNALHPIETMSVTKSITNLAIGILVDEGLISNLDIPVYSYFPQWSEGKKRQITIRHLLNHTSGISTETDAGAPDYLGTALSMPLVFDPGTAFEYNNRATNVLSGLVRLITGKRLDQFVRERILNPLEITDYEWRVDGKDLATGQSGFRARPEDLAKIAQMTLDGGVWKGKRLISREWLEFSVKQSQPYNESCGALWWRLNDRGVTGYFAAGYYGQYVIILPKERVIAIRQAKLPSAEVSDDADVFDDFPELIAELFEKR